MILRLTCMTTLLATAACALAQPHDAERGRAFDPEKDLLSLHYDHAPDKDDGQSAAADRTILQSAFGKDWIKEHVVAVSGAYGENADRFNPKSDRVMDVTWNGLGGWLAAHDDWDRAVDKLVARWRKTLAAGGDVWVKEGGQSDITTAALKRIRQEAPDVDTTSRVHVVQHSDWNEDQTTDAALDYAKANAHYIRIRDANAYLNIRGGDEAFERAATSHPEFADTWKAAFEYYDPDERLDFSDTGELLHILGLGELGVDKFRQRFLSERAPGRTDDGAGADSQ